MQGGAPQVDRGVCIQASFFLAAASLVLNITHRGTVDFIVNFGYTA